MVTFDTPPNPPRDDVPLEEQVGREHGPHGKAPKGYKPYERDAVGTDQTGEKR